MLLDNEAMLMDNNTMLLDSKSVLLDNNTMLVDNKTILSDNNTMLSGIYRSILAGQEGTDSQHQSVSTTLHCAFNKKR